MTKEKVFTFTASQAAMINSKELFPLFCAGYASGKSYTLGFCAATGAMHSSNAVIGVYAPDYDIIRKVSVPSITAWFDRLGVSYKFNENKYTIFTASPGVGDVIFKSIKEPESLVGYQTYQAHIDELDTLPKSKARYIFYKILGRTRLVPNDISEEHLRFNEETQKLEPANKIYSYSTPEGFKFCYEMWDPNSKNALENPEFKIYRGRTYDNPALSTTWIRQLEASYPPKFLKSYLNGEFVNLEAGTVYYAFDRLKHTSKIDVTKYDELHIGLDFNVNKMCAIITVQRNEKCYIISEIVNKYDTPDIIKAIKNKFPDNKVICYPDASGAKRTSSNASQSDLALLKNAGFEVRANKTNPRVKDRIASVNNMFDKDNLLIDSIACPELVKCLESQCYNDAGEPDKNSGYDHANDALGYRIHYNFSIKKPIISVPYQFVRKY